MTESGRADEQLQVIARFEVRHRSYLARDGSIHRRLPAFASDTRQLVRLYRAMVLVRAFDLKAVALQRTGRLSAAITSPGQSRISRSASPSDRRPLRVPASPTPSSCARSPALPYVCSATAPPRRATSGRR